ncbi:MAG: hypothetical protein B7Z75_02825 [Acidocella sp. 20-57-95]|nr:MAG: hypothetical protein B7Z75_02825 [Acidocella sp. 20-57-95]OYV57978.1 MAG: hypothetical protein B7Z71_11460 [Acidocella sp. 21-58-7]HQT64484.1 MAPEG family protein [Acidocella sp.]HQU05193.1 MAPEG family protein [Acidocella sp.]
MTTIPVTLASAGILGLLYLVLSARVVMARGKYKIGLGDNAAASVALGKEHEASPLHVAVRTHANFAENVPLALVLLGGIEAAGAAHWVVELLAVLLVAGRISHPFGMLRPAPNPFRAGGAMLTWVMIGWASIEALLLVI